MTIKPGNLDDPPETDSMAEAIRFEFEALWELVYETPLPSESSRQRQIFFVAIARGILKYLEAKQNELITSMQFASWPGSENVQSLDLNIELL